MVGEGSRHRGELGLLRRGVFRYRKPAWLAGNRSATGPISIAMDARGRARSLWVEQVDENNVPLGTPRSYRVGYSKPLEDKVLKARDEIMSGNPQEGTAEDMEDSQSPPSNSNMANLPENSNPQAPNANNLDLSKLMAVPEHMQNIVFKPLEPPKGPPKP
jgi:hypothetical protein